MLFLCCLYHDKMSQDNNETIQDDSFEEFHTASEITCWGCREGIANQLGHMDYGGCLYFEEEYDDDVIETMSKTETEDDKAVCEAILAEIIESLVEE